MSSRARALLRASARAYLGLRLGRADRRFIFILGHMRSGSTLLAHLLLEHPDITGYGERNATYRSPKDLDALTVDGHLKRRQVLHMRRYVLDQINHTRMIVDDSILADPRLYKIVLVRDPEPSISSMVRTFEPLYGNWTIERAAAEYTERLDSLTRYLSLPAFEPRTIFLRYEDLTRGPREALDRIGAMLELDRPIPERYSAHRFTGRRGDPSARIKTGEVRATSQPPLPISAELLAPALAAHEACLRAGLRTSSPA